MGGLLGAAQTFIVICALVVLIKAAIDALSGKASLEPWMKPVAFVLGGAFALTLVTDFYLGAPAGSLLNTLLKIIPDVVETGAGAITGSLKATPVPFNR